MEHIEAVIRAARSLNPSIYVMARSAYLRGLTSLRAAGAARVFSGKGEVALAFTEALLRRLGATGDQIDRERARVHDELVGQGPTPADHKYALQFLNEAGGLVLRPGKSLNEAAP